MMLMCPNECILSLLAGDCVLRLLASETSPDGSPKIQGQPVEVASQPEQLLVSCGQSEPVGRELEVDPPDAVGEWQLR
jgi:hypothetical protein